MSIMIFYSTSKSFFFHHGRKFFSQTGVPGPANARSPLHYVPFRLAFGNPSIPAQVPLPRKPPTSFFRSLHSPSVTIDVRFPRVLSQVFTCSGTRANSITAQTAHLPFSLFFCFCRLLPTFAFGANSNVTKIA